MPPLLSPPPRSTKFPRYPFPKGARRSTGVDAPKGHGIAAQGEALGLGASPTPIPLSPEGAQHFPPAHGPGRGPAQRSRNPALAVPAPKEHKISTVSLPQRGMAFHRC